MQRRLAWWAVVALVALGVGPEARRLAAAEPALPAPADLVPVTIRDVKMDRTTDTPLVILETAKKDRLLVVAIGHGEAFAILRKLRAVEPPPRPMTHDLLKSVVEGLGGKLDKAVITRLDDGTFYAVLVVRRGETIVPIDARPSDAMALALRMAAPIFVARAVLDEAGIRPGQLEEPNEQPPFQRPPPGGEKQAI